MAATGVEKLNERERACLRLVGEGLQSKEIARQLDQSYSRTRKDIESALGKLGVSSRRDAARQLAAYEKMGGHGAPGASCPLPLAQSFAQPLPQDERHGLVVREERPLFGGTPPAARILPERQGGTRNDLSNQQTTILIVAIVAIALLGAGILIYALGSLSDQIILVPTPGH